MAGLGRVVVGYAKADLRNRRLYGADINGGRCVSCGRDTYFNPTAISALGARDAIPVCCGCKNRYPAEIQEAL